MAPIFRMVCTPGWLAAGAPGWAAETLREGEVALIVDDGGLEAINAAAHVLGLVTVSIVRSESSPAAQDETVIAFAGDLPLVWVGAQFSDTVRTWAHQRPPMTLLVEAGEPPAEEQRGRIARFLAVLGRQSE